MYRLLALSILRALTRRVCCCQDAESHSLLQTAATSESPVSTSQASVQTELPGLILELKKEAELVLIDYSGNVFFLHHHHPPTRCGLVWVRCLLSDAQLEH